MDEPETPGLALFRACNPYHAYNAYWGMAEESRQVYETRAERFLASDFVAGRLREVEAEWDRCVVCNVSVRADDGGLCDDHKYDEQISLEQFRRLRAERDYARETCANWERLYREASGLPDTEHMARRMEAIAQKAEQAIAERNDLAAKLDRVQALCDRYPLVGEGQLRAILDAPTTGDSQ